MEHPSPQCGQWIDCHSHILPCMDDGSSSVEQSLQMLRECVRQGVGTMIATPHFYAAQNSPEQFLRRRADAYVQLVQAELSTSEHTAWPDVLCAAEVAYFANISHCADLASLCVENTNVLLLEMPFCEWSDFQLEEVAALMDDWGYRVVLVHPERFCFSAKNRRMLEQLAQMSAALQVNAGSLQHWRTRGLALKLLQMTDTPLLGSDCHNMTSRPPDLLGGRKVIQKRLGDAFMRGMDSCAEQIVQAATRGN